MRVLVTGATGFLGGVVARDLVRDGHEVTGVGRNLERGAALEEAGVRFIPLDLRSPEPRERLLDGMDGVIHAAARSSLWGRWEDFVADNVTVSARLAHACAERGVRLVHISTPSVYNATGRRVRVPETTPVGPRFDSLYARSKFLAEEAVRLAHPEAAILRPRGVYGPGDTSILPRLVRALRSRRLPRLTRTEVHTELTHVRNAAHAARLALEQPAPGVFNVTDGETVPIWALLDRLADRLGVPRPHPYVPAPLVEGAAALLEGLAQLHPAKPEPVLTASGVRLLTRAMTLDLTRVRERLGYAPVVHPDEGLDEVLRAVP
ncbi:NAD-dependent epimerase/dehydratase:Short-chain dehydrogenase/reductase SDR:3-beta hydroxysteroid dehydrogenase/isomerase:polysaccharide biosynthesis protein CapD:dTDP-4-dehydrorhamnose reductase:NmrA-like protein [Deinococcus aerius]|uniref:NAD-dependent epimerase/dehydratase domain-containing protein n=1 Tax=Deinococcus aerius TaxID=200253 RepID=A0A2I9CWG1_9DEIO|nr:NAD(P)-dependent oxidoreductase [Deinococcus aerius]GBF06344.1 NAD-dependent epimerase/dehydratase:Short-chain dehydrogenase/reductase SDR:3-beta hydroxysteroid dehydrogenase/isomerase:polysaccharide biosynthesis protein CapD:dTDP-4-dehydrorhamnose reductase:NmrA-like protein [Deinococcus aerius]